MEQGIVEYKEYFTDSEAGSGSLYVPILGDIFPNLFGQKMKPMDRWFVFVHIENSLYKYEIEKDIYDQILIGDKVSIGTDKYGMPDVKPLK